MHKKGFTLVEAIIVVLVIAAILALLIPVLRERERQRLQAIADVEPWEVFEFRAEPAKESFSDDEDIVVRCEILNTTGYSLTLPEDRSYFTLYIVDGDYFAGGMIVPVPISKTAIAPGKSVSFNLGHRPFGTGVVESRIVYGRNRRISDLFSAIGVEQSAESRNLRTGEKRFQSNAYQLVVKESESSQLPTFDETIARIEQWRASR